MSPIVKKKPEKYKMPAKYVLLIITFVCSLTMLITFGANVIKGPINGVVGVTIVPFQEGISSMGRWIGKRRDEIVQIRTLLDENARLKDQVALLTEENTVLQQDKYELHKLQALFKLDEQYNKYEKVGARIIARDSGNWYASFVIDKGTKDGLDVDMNVIADGGLVGRITTVGPNWARVTSIISDDSNVSGMTLATEDNLIVSGDLKEMADGCITFTKLVDSQNKVAVGDKIVTSNISDKFLPNILIGYISEIKRDSNNLTKSGLLLPVVDFEHLSEVLVITDKKQTIEAME